MSAYLSSDRIRRFHRLRDRLIVVLGGVHPGMLRRDLLGHLWRDPNINRLFKTPDALNELLGQVLLVYNGDFYQDPATKRWSLTRRRQIYDSAAKASKELSSRRSGNTACGKTAEFLEAADA